MKCVTCPTGYSRSNANSSSVSGCYVVLNGYEIKKAGGQPTLCEAGTYELKGGDGGGSFLTNAKIIYDAFLL